MYGPAMQAVGPGHLVAGRYRLHGQIGRGAMGIVWRSRDELLDRDVAVKQVRIAVLGYAEGDTVYQRTLREAKTAARLSHPGVVKVFDVVEEDGSAWIVMELVRARSLDQVIAEDGPLRPAEAAEVGQRLLSALASAHAAGVLHRDVKPSNVLITPDGGAVLTDFGIATFEDDPSLTMAGLVVGTPGFTAPERCRGKPATPASDLWSLGATLYTAVEGRGPFDRLGGSAVVTAGVINEGAPRSPSAGPLGPVIEALLRADPGTRPGAAAAAGLLSAAAEQARSDRTQPAGRWPGRVPAAGPPADAGLAADAAPSAGPGPEAQTEPGVVPDLPGAPAFADVHEFPDLPALSELSGSMELPAFLDLPQPGGPGGLPAGQAVPWSPVGPGSWESGDPLSLPSPAHSSPSAQPGDAAPGNAAPGSGGSGNAAPGNAAPGSAPPGSGAGRPGNSRRSVRYRRLLAVAAGVAAVAVAGVIAWTAFPHPVNAVASPGSSVAQSPGHGRAPVGSSGSHSTQPGGLAGGAGGVSPASPAVGTAPAGTAAASSTHSGAGSSPGTNGTGAGTGTGTGTGTGSTGTGSTGTGSSGNRRQRDQAGPAGPLPRRSAIAGSACLPPPRRPPPGSRSPSRKPGR